MAGVVFAAGEPGPFGGGLLGERRRQSPGDEQLAAFVGHEWRRPDLDLASVAPRTATEVAGALVETTDRRRFCAITMVLELCGPRQSAAQVGRVEEGRERRAATAFRGRP